VYCSLVRSHRGQSIAALLCVPNRSPYGLMNSPNLLASAVSQRTKQIKILIYGNLTPLHDPLRLAEELAMVDCLSNGRLISGFARGIPRNLSIGVRQFAGKITEALPPARSVSRWWASVD